MSRTITIVKRDHQGQAVWEYNGIELERTPTFICIEAYFRRNSADIGAITFNTGDRLLEWFYNDRYYNVFRLHNGDSNHIKGWYCNITRPATIHADRVEADDLALDVVVTPSGEIHLLDEDELDLLDLSDAELDQVWQAVAQIRSLVAEAASPFDGLDGEASYD